MVGFKLDCCVFSKKKKRKKRFWRYICVLSNMTGAYGCSNAQFGATWILCSIDFRSLLPARTGLYVVVLWNIYFYPSLFISQNFSVSLLVRSWIWLRLNRMKYRVCPRQNYYALNKDCVTYSVLKFSSLNWLLSCWLGRVIIAYVICYCKWNKQKLKSLSETNFVTNFLLIYSSCRKKTICGREEQISNMDPGTTRPPAQSSC